MEITNYLTKVNYTSSSSKENLFIVLHYTANDGDTAMNNAVYFNSVNRSASAHYFIDENEIVRVVEDKNIAWHCGGASYVHDTCRNSNSIGIEMCSRIDSSGNYYIKDEIVAKAKELVKYLMELHDIPIENVIRHYDVTGKSCPAPWVLDVTLWNDFKENLIESEEEELRYNTIDELPDYAVDTITKLVEKGYLQGDGTGFDLSEDMIRMFVINDRAGMYD